MSPAEKACVEYARELLRKKDISDAAVVPLLSLGQLRNKQGGSVGQVDAGAIVCLPDGLWRCLVATVKPRLQPKIVVELGFTIAQIIAQRDRAGNESLEEFRSCALHGAVFVEALPQDPKDKEFVLQIIKDKKFALFVLKGGEYSLYSDNYSEFLA